MICDHEWAISDHEGYTNYLLPPYTPSGPPIPTHSSGPPIPPVSLFSYFPQYRDPQGCIPVLMVAGLFICLFIAILLFSVDACVQPFCSKY
jgi:hypothetical protein